MAIRISKYTSGLGITLREAFIEVTEIFYYPRRGQANFAADIFAEEFADTPLERNVITGYLDVGKTDEGTSLLERIEEAIQTKIDNIVGKTQEECDEHNQTATCWEDVWEMSYARFISDESSEEEEDEDEYIEAARILLEGE